MKRPLKVAMLIQGYLPRIGGAERQLAALAPLLRERNVEVSVLTRRYTGLAPYEEIGGVPVYRLPIPGPKALASLSYSATAIPRLMKINPDVIHAHELLSPTTTAVLAKRLLGKPVVTKLLRGGTLGDIAKLQKKESGRRRLQAFRTQVDCFIAISQEIEDELTAVGVSADRQIFIPNGVDSRRFSPADHAEKQQLRSQLNLPAGQLAVFTGRLAAEKRIQDVIHAWGGVRAAHNDAHLLVIGSGEEEQSLKQVAGEGVHFLGRIEDVAPYLRAANLFILPSATEGLSNALLEAMACGLSSVVTAVGGATDLITHQQSGWLVPPNAVDVLEQGIKTILADCSLQGKMGEQARQVILDRYTLVQTADRLRELYDTVLEK